MDVVIGTRAGRYRQGRCLATATIRIVVAAAVETTTRGQQSLQVGFSFQIGTVALSIVVIFVVVVVVVVHSICRRIHVHCHRLLFRLR